MTTAVAENIFEIFRKHRIPVNGVLYPRHISASIHLWEKARQDHFQKAIDEMIRQDYVAKDGDAYRLTQKGYEYLYRHCTLEDTIGIILSDFRKRRIGQNDILLLSALLGTLQNNDRYHFDNYDKAIHVMVEKGWMIANGRGFILTEEGYTHVYNG